MTDLVSRIRRKIYDWLPTGDHQSAAQALLVQAADEIAFLRARILELEAAHEDASGAILQAVAVERERCAKLCDSAADAAWAWWDARADPADRGAGQKAEEIAAAIRAEP